MNGSLVVVVVLSAWAAYTLAQRQGRDSSLWAVGGLMGGPLAVLALLIMGQNRKTIRVCADCKGKVPFDAPVCRHCGRDERTATGTA